LLSFQKVSNNRHGLSFSSKVISKSHYASSSTSHHVFKEKKNHAFLYSRFVKSSHALSYDTYDHKNIFMHNSSPSIYMWIPKNSSLDDRIAYIYDYKNNVILLIIFVLTRRNQIPNGFGLLRANPKDLK
jgi:CTP:phosphocholine cytidylyltransferase-like protein